MTAVPVREDAGMPFPQATGRGVKIAIIDSGVNTGHSHIVSPVHGVEFDVAPFPPEPTGGVADQGVRPTMYEDQLGHGTAVTAAIQEKAPSAEYYILKLFGASLRTSTRRLIQAIEWTIDNRIDLVNLSLGTPNFDYRAEFETLVARAAASGTLLISARCAGEHPVLPGVLPGVAAVDVDWNLPRHSYRLAEVDGAPCFFASGFPRSLPGMAPSRNLNGISFAVANMTGIVARAYEGLADRSLAALRQTLKSESL